MRIFIFFAVAMMVVGCAGVPADESGAQTVLGVATLDNLHRVSGDLYRSEQPDEMTFKQLEDAGIKSVLNLRRHHSDEDDAAQTELFLCELPINAGDLTESQIRAALLLIHSMPKPVLVHCWHGSDRTGAVVASYRVVMENWNIEDAIAELEREEFGHHRTVYRNIPRLLRSINWDKMRADISGNQPVTL